MKLDHGYYWISYRGMGPRISRWDGMFWQAEHDEAVEGLLRSEEVQVLSSRRIMPPASVVNNAKNSMNNDADLFVPRLMHGDCLDRMRDIDNGSVDMILCDLPYGTTQNRWDAVIPLEPMWKHYWRVLKPTGVVALTASQPFSSVLVVSQLKTFRHEWIWNKNRGSNFANTVREPMKEHESVLIFSRGKWTYNPIMQERTGGDLSRVRYDFNSDVSQATDSYGKFSNSRTQQLPTMRVPSSVQKFNCEVGLHPTQKPVDLMSYLIQTYTNPGETILDACSGSCSTGIAAYRLGRQFIGIEKDDGYYVIGAKRMQQEITERLAV